MKLKRNEKALRENILKVANIAYKGAKFTFEKGEQQDNQIHNVNITFLKFTKEYDYDIEPEKGILLYYWFDNEDKKWKVSPDGYGYADIFDSYSEFWTHKVTDAMDVYIGEYEGGLTWIYNDDEYDKKERIVDYEKIDYSKNDRERQEYIAELYKDII